MYQKICNQCNEENVYDNETGLCLNCYQDFNEDKVQSYYDYEDDYYSGRIGV